MKKKVVKTKKKMTIETLAEKIGEVASSVEDLAVMTQKGFSGLEERMNERFEQVDRRFEDAQNRLENLELGQKKIHQEILNIHDSFVKRSEFDNLVQRLSRVEQKLKLKSK